MKKLFVFAGVLLLAFSPVAAQNADSVSFRRADGKPVTIETVDRDSLGIDTLRRIDTVDNGLVTLRDGGRDGSLWFTPRAEREGRKATDRTWKCRGIRYAAQETDSGQA